jgi:hypothetical protein
MLAITLEPQQNVNAYPHDQYEDWRFEVKVINDGIFPEVRLSIISGKRKKRLSIEEPIEAEHKATSPI